MCIIRMPHCWPVLLRRTWLGQLQLKMAAFCRSCHRRRRCRKEMPTVLPAWSPRWDNGRIQRSSHKMSCPAAAEGSLSGCGFKAGSAFITARRGHHNLLFLLRHERVTGVAHSKSLLAAAKTTRRGGHALLTPPNDPLLDIHAHSYCN